MTVSYSLITVASRLHDSTALGRRLRPLYTTLEAHGAERRDEAPPDKAMAVLVATGVTERAILDLHRERQAVVPGEPLTLVTRPEDNSLPAALETLARVRQHGGRGAIVQIGGPHDDAGIRLLGNAMEDLDVRRRLHTARIGLIGAPSDWLVASSPSGEIVRTRWGPTVVPIDIRDVLAAQHADSAAAATLAASFRARATAVAGPVGPAIDTAAAVHPALRSLIAAHRLDAVSVRCFDLIDLAGTTGCLALAALNDSSFVAGCEGDLVATVAMLWARELLGAVSWIANPADADPTRGVLRLAHCTIAPSLVSDLQLTSHFESGLGVGISGHIPPGPVTIIRIGGRDMDELYVVDGEAERTEPSPHMCRTQVDIKLPPERVQRILTHPLGNHLVMVSGHHRERLQACWDRVISPTG